MTKLTQNSWLGGQMDVRMTGRQDMRNYRNGASVLKNFLPVKLGSIRKRPGTDYVADLTSWIGTREFRMIPFGFKSGEGYVLVFCPGATPAARAFGIGESGLVSKDISGTILYDAGELDEIGYVQCNDVVFLAHRNYPPSKITHTDSMTFVYETIDFNSMRLVPRITSVDMKRKYFEDFTFDTKVQDYLDNCKAKADFTDDDDRWVIAYNTKRDEKFTQTQIDSGYAEEQNPEGRDPATGKWYVNRKYSGVETVNYRASVVVDGLEGELSPVASASFTAPWTESQTIKLAVECETPSNGTEVELRLYKENGGTYGLIGSQRFDTEHLTIVRQLRDERVTASQPPSYKFSKVVNETEGERLDPSSVRQEKIGTTRYTSTVVCETEWTAGLEAIKIYRTIGGAETLVTTFEVGARRIECEFTDDNIAPDTSETPIDTTGAASFSAADDYPGCVGLYQQRLVWASSDNDPARIWMSRAGEFYEYRPHVSLQTDDAIDFILPITQFARVNFIVELGRLFAFCECTELVVGSASTAQGISYETIVATEHSHLGCTKRLPPIVANNTLLFVNRTGQSVRDYDERIGSSRFGGTDVSVFSSSVFADNPIVDWTWQQEPNSTVWCVLADGRLASFTYDKEQEIAAWAVHELGGGGKARGIAKTCAVFGRDAAHPTTGEVMLIVERGEGAARKLTLERMRPWGSANGATADRLCMDSMRTGGVTGMDQVVVDGVTYSGWKIESVMTTMPPAIGDQGGSSQFDVKLGQHVHLRTVGSEGGEVFAVGMEDQCSEIDRGASRQDAGRSEFKDVDVVLAGSNNRDGRVTVRHNGTGPFQLALLELDYEIEG